MCEHYVQEIITGYRITTSSSLNRPALHILSKSSPPAAYSMTIAKWVGVSKTCKQSDILKHAPIYIQCDKDLSKSSLQARA